jgi:hypothetical protein
MDGPTDGTKTIYLAPPIFMYLKLKYLLSFSIFFYLKHGLLQEGEIRNIVYTVEPGHVVTSIKPVSNGHLFLVLS